MPTNLPPEYYEAEARYRAAQTPQEKVSTLEELLSTIPKHKGTDKLRADMRRRLSKLRSAAQASKKVSKQVSPFHIEREGAGQVVIIGPPNVGKSALVAALTNATPEVADFPFSTWSPTPGMMPVENIQVQLIDTPPLSREYIEPEMMNLLRQADLLILVIDLQAYPIQQLEDTIAILADYRIMARRQQEQQADRGRITFVPLLVVVNKTDDEDYDGDFSVLCELLGEEWHFIPVSAATGRNFAGLKQAVFEQLGIIRIYSKPPGREPDYSAPFVMARGSTVEEFAAKVHKDFYEKLKTARLWGESAVYEGQMVGRDHLLQDGDVVELRI